MRKKTVLLLFIILNALLVEAQEYPTFSKDELDSIYCSNPISKNRILDYQKTMQKLAKLPKKAQLTQLNFYLNLLLPQYDAITKHKEDDWATPKEFLTIGYGDCEDYAIIKYYSLLRLGYNKNQLYLTVVREKYYGGYHMVLSYFERQNSSPLIFDNLSSKLLPLKQRSDLQAKIFINDTGVYRIDKKGSLVKVAHKYQTFEELEKKVAKNL
jgi:predicted transglutaminase-like cysteine proteinase